MKYLKNTTEFYIEEPTVLSLGKFDGIHRGHELLMEHLASKKEAGLAAVIFTFNIPPRKSVEQVEAKVLTTNEEKMAAQQALMAAQKDNGINMLSSIGCLPMLIQWPFFIALYNAAAYTTGISSSTFYGIPLGHPSVVLVIISGVLYFIQTWISTLSMTPEQKKSGMAMLIMSPAMIVVFSFMSPAGVALYWAVSNAFQVLQILVFNNPFKIIEERNRLEAEEKERKAKIRRAKKKAHKRK